MYVIYQKVSDQTGQVQEVIFIPTPSDKNREGVEIDAPMIYPETIPGMESRLMINLEINELYYDYYAPETIETKLSGLQQENSELRQAILELTMMIASPQ